MNFSDNEKIAGKKNYTGIVFVVVLHIIAGYGIVSGLGKKMISKMIEPVETKIIEEVAPPPPKELPPPPPPPEMKAPTAIHSSGRSERAATAASAERDRQRDQREASNHRYSPSPSGTTCTSSPCGNRCTYPGCGRLQHLRQARMAEVVAA